MRGPLFENWVLAELLKSRWNYGKQQNLYFWRSHVGKEIDFLIVYGGDGRRSEVDIVPWREIESVATADIRGEQKVTSWFYERSSR